MSRRRYTKPSKKLDALCAASREYVEAANSFNEDPSSFKGERQFDDAVFALKIAARAFVADEYPGDLT